MKPQSVRSRLLCEFVRIVCFVAAAGLAWVAQVDAAPLSGRAYAALINAPVLGTGPFYVADTGDLASDGGWQGAGLNCTQVPNILRAEKLMATTGGSGDYVSSTTSMTSVLVLPSHPAQLAASFVRAETAATAGSSRGSTEIRGLTLGGRRVSVTGEVNQRVDIPGVATLVINEQRIMPGGMVVNALRLTLATGDEIIVSSARSAIGRRSVDLLSLRVPSFIPVSSTGRDCGGTTRPRRLRWDGGNPLAPLPFTRADQKGGPSL